MGPKDKLRRTPFLTSKQDGKGVGLAEMFSMRFKVIMEKLALQAKKVVVLPLLLLYRRTIKHADTLIGGNTMRGTIDSRVELSKFLKENVHFYTQEWLKYLEENKTYITSLMKDSGDHNYYMGNPILMIVSTSFSELKTEEIMDHAK